MWTLYVKGLLGVLIMVTIYGGYHMFAHKYTYTAFYDKLASFAYLQMFYRSILPFFMFYLIASKKYISNAVLIRCFIYFFVTYTWSFYDSVFSDTWNPSELSNTYNVGYRIVGLIPMLYLLKLNENMKLAILFILLCLVILSSKRGAILVGLIMTLFYVRSSIRYMSKSKFILFTILLIAFVTVLYVFVVDVFVQSSGMQEKWERTISGDLSGRDYIYSYYLSYIIQEQGLSLFFGNGADSTLRIWGFYAHNDWLEIGMNQGLLGIVVYFIYWLFFYKEWKFKNMRTNYDTCILCILIAYLLTSLFSMSINDMPHSATFALAYAIASKHKVSYKLQSLTSTKKIHICRTLL